MTKFVPQLCCRVNPRVKCKCGAVACVTCLEAVSYENSPWRILKSPESNDPCADEGNLDSRGYHWWRIA